jgi:hypothetical protein
MSFGVRSMPLTTKITLTAMRTEVTSGALKRSAIGTAQATTTAATSTPVAVLIENATSTNFLSRLRR